MMLSMPDANVKYAPTPCGLVSKHFYPASISFLFSFFILNKFNGL